MTWNTCPERDSWQMVVCSLNLCSVQVPSSAVFLQHQIASQWEQEPVGFSNFLIDWLI